MRPYDPDGHGGYKHVKAHRLRRKALLVQEAGGKCVRCGYDKCLSALQFHHRDPATKLFSLSSGIKRLDLMREEAAKCDLLCANCHAEAHEELHAAVGLVGPPVSDTHGT